MCKIWKQMEKYFLTNKLKKKIKMGVVTGVHEIWVFKNEKKYIANSFCVFALFFHFFFNIMPSGK